MKEPHVILSEAKDPLPMQADVVKVSRRDFVKLTSAASAGLVLAQFPRAAGAAEEGAHPLGTFVEVGTDGLVTIYVSKSDMGQGVRTALPMIVAEEMDADWKKVRIRQADLDKKYGSMGTGGSSSVRTMWTPMRKAGAAARAMLVSAAAAKWSVDAKEITVKNGVVAHGAKKATFGELAAAAAKVDVPKDVTFKDPAKYTIVGKKASRLDNPDLVVGKAHYGIDVRLPGMLYATVLRAPVFGATVASFDDTKAKAVPGVKHVVALEPHGHEAPWSGVAVIATSTWAAMKGRDALAVKWDEGKGKSETTASLSAAMHAAVADGAATKRVRNDGDVDAALAAAAKKIEATYEVPYLAHATMEPMTATASTTANGLELWLPTQFADWAAGSAGGAVGVKDPKVHVTLLGGGFGRRAFPDFAIEAALLSKAAGAPVKVQWTREDDMQHDFYRPPSVHRVVAALDGDGKVAAWHHRMSSPGINAWMGRGEAHESETGGIDDLPHAIANLRLEYAPVESSVPRGWWRSVENSANAFVVESMIDELAHAAGKDPIDFHLALLPPGKVIESKRSKEHSFQSDRFRRVIELAREKSGWGKPLPAGRARGFAAWWSFVSYVAEVAEVSVDKNGTPRVHRVVAVVDCGTPVNPDGIAAQLEGGIVYGLTAALQGAITIDGGAVQQSNFHDYPLLTLEQMPAVDVHIVPSGNAPSGTGEPGLPPVAPAVANALFKLTGKRVRKLPIGT
jgi:isoquinoline 1-oxidoreductase beta subunit